MVLLFAHWSKIILKQTFASVAVHSVVVVKATIALVPAHARQARAHARVLVTLARVVRPQRVALAWLAPVARHQVPVSRLALVALLTCDVITRYFEGRRFQLCCGRRGSENNPFAFEVGAQRSVRNLFVVLRNYSVRALNLISYNNKLSTLVLLNVFFFWRL